MFKAIKVYNLMEYKCTICNKNYSSYQSLWIHNNKFHKLQSKHTNINGHPSNNSQLNNINNQTIQFNINQQVIQAIQAMQAIQANINQQIIQSNINQEVKETNTNQQIIQSNINQEVKDTNTNQQTTHNNSIKKKFKCRHCNKNLSYKQSKWRHEKYCKEKEKINNNLPIIENKEETNLLINEDNNLLINEDNKLITHKSEETKNDYPINNQLINIIIDKTKTIEELKYKIESNNTNILLLNNINIICRHEDNYLNAIQICEAGNKNFNDWFNQDTTDILINEISKTLLENKSLVDFEDEYIWINPYLAIQLCQWISPIFVLQITKWIELCSKNIKLLNEQKKEIEMKDYKIQLLENTYMKKQQRIEYPGKNIIYIVTTDSNKKQRNYIIGKTTSLKARLSVYNKTSEHEVIYYKDCGNKENMDIVENIVLHKLKKYREKTNRDRFILPLEKDISFFINIINDCILFISD